MTIAPEAGPGHRHSVSFFEHPQELVQQVTAFCCEAASLDDSVLLVVGQERRARLAEALALVGIDLAASEATGDLRVLDADALVRGVTSGDHVDVEHLTDVAAAVIDELAAGGRTVHIFGEMVALLWRDGRTSAAVELEARWSRIVEDRPVVVMCAYEVDSFAAVEDLEAAAAICREHSRVSAPDRYPRRRHERTSIMRTGRVTQTFVPAPPAVAAVRRLVHDALSAWAVDEVVVQDATLVVSELATNALLHARSPFRVTASRRNGAVLLEVEDVSPTEPELRAPASQVAHGRGIAMVGSIAQRWGTEVRPGGKVVWAELDAP